jgi:hypothetical protein
MAALLEKDRNTIYTEFRKILGEEATQAMLSQFPARDVDELVTKEHLDRRLAEIRVELGELGDRMTGRMLTIAGIQTAIIGGLLAITR